MTDAATPSNLNPSSTATNEAGTATVYVYKPTITFMDTTKTPMEDSLKNADGSYKYDAENYVSVIWLHGTTEATTDTVEGTAPTLEYTYSTPKGCIDDTGLVTTYNEFYVNVAKVESTGKTGKGNNQTDLVTDITDYVKFAHADCTCSFNPNNGEFIIHLTQVYTSLTIKKVGADAIDPNQSFIFNVVELDENDDPIENRTVTVTVHENGTITIDGLLVNHSYKVTEDTSWSWRYTFSNWVYKSSDADLAKSETTNNAIITLGSENNVITFTNTRSIIWWLDGDSWCNNIFKNPNE